jgi:DNA repair exonuclease SbcCD ATPase subunit
MTDIVERLRELIEQTDAFANSRHHSFVTTQQMARESAAALKEAADEIERLHQDVSVVHADICAENDNLKAEIERLRGELHSVHAHMNHLRRVRGDEIERLRAALESLTKDPPSTLSSEPDTDAEVIIKMRAIARAALEQT